MTASLYMCEGANIIHGDEWENRDRKELFLPEDVPALVNCFKSKRLQQVRIPASVKVIGYSLEWVDHLGLTRGSRVTFSVDGNNTNYYSIGGVLFTYPFYSVKYPDEFYIYIGVLWDYIAECQKTLVAYPAKRTDEVYYVPYGVEQISGRAFYGAKHLRKVILPDTVKIIDGQAFMDSEISEVVIPASVTDIGHGAFDTSSLSVTIITPAGSAAETYAIENKISYRNE